MVILDCFLFYFSQDVWCVLKAKDAIAHIYRSTVYECYCISEAKISCKYNLSLQVICHHLEEIKLIVL